MKKAMTFHLVRWALVPLAIFPALALADVEYKLTPDPAAGQMGVSVTVPKGLKTEEFRIPAWCPGFYFLLDYQKKISDVRAVDAGGNTLNVHASDVRGWVVDNPSEGPITLSYRILGNDPGLGFFGVNVQKNAAFVNGAAAFMYPTTRKSEKVHLVVKNPAGWDIATPMDPAKDGNGFSAGGYDEFIDHPIQLGQMTRRKFMVKDVPFEAVFVGPDGNIRCDVDRETERLRKVALPALEMFGGSAFKHYTFFIHLKVGDFGGGLEHRACNVIATPNSTELNLDDLAAHEYFHAWNVKQIRPSVLGPFDYTTKVRTANLWFAEGVTDYYSKLHTYASGLRGLDWLLNDLTGQVAELQGSQNRKKYTVADASKMAWENGGFGVGDLSYYTKGLLIGLIFDSVIRSETEGKKSLDDVMRKLFAEHKLPNPGYGEDELRKAINEVAGKDLTALYQKMVLSTDELPYGLVESLGLRVLIPDERVYDLGVTTADGVVKSLSQEAQEAGLQLGDHIVSVRKSQRDPTADVKVERGSGSLDVTVPLTMSIVRNLRVEFDPFADAKAIARRTEWLNRK